jgi:hypothetical protein
MPVTIEANYREVFNAETLAKIDKLCEADHDLIFLIKLVDRFGEDDFVDHIDTYLELTEDFYDEVIETFLDGVGDFSDLKYLRNSYHGQYTTGADFVEDHFAGEFNNLPWFVVVDYEQSWEQLEADGYSIKNGFVFETL